MRGLITTVSLDSLPKTIKLYIMNGNSPLKEIARKKMQDEFSGLGPYEKNSGSKSKFLVCLRKIKCYSRDLLNVMV